jgi:hypothetical protein
MIPIAPKQGDKPFEPEFIRYVGTLPIPSDFGIFERVVQSDNCNNAELIFFDA